MMKVCHQFYATFSLAHRFGTPPPLSIHRYRCELHFAARLEHGSPRWYGPSGQSSRQPACQKVDMFFRESDGYQATAQSNTNAIPNDSLSTKSSLLRWEAHIGNSCKLDAISCDTDHRCIGLPVFFEGPWPILVALSVIMSDLNDTR